MSVSLRRQVDHRTAGLVAYSQQHRRVPTPSEALLWRELVSSKLDVPFRRQEVLLGRWIADFVAPSLRLAVEIDGSSHRRRKRADARRDEKLRRLGYAVLRIPAELVEKDPEEALRRVRASVEALR